MTSVSTDVTKKRHSHRKSRELCFPSENIPMRVNPYNTSVQNKLTLGDYFPGDLKLREQRIPAEAGVTSSPSGLCAFENLPRNGR